MSADFSKPVKEDLYTDILSEIRDNQTALAIQDLAGASSVPEGAIQFKVANARWERYTSGAWQALRALTQSFEIKVRDTDKLNGQTAAYYQNADHLNAGSLDTARIDTTTEYTLDSATKVPLASALKGLYDWTVGALAGKLASSGKAADSAQLNGVAESTAATANTIVKRDSSKDIKARLFRSNYAAQSSVPADSADVAFRLSTSNDYIRFMTLTALRSWLGGAGSDLEADKTDGFHLSTAATGSDANTIYFRT